MNKPNGVLSNAERQQILHEWNKTHAKYPEVCIHELFEAQVKRTPQATAVVFGSERVSYDELNRRANRLAHYLRKNGVRPEERVGICAERGVEMVVGLLAVLKAGGAYMPLDPKYPEERLQYMVKDSAPVAVLTQKSTDGLLRRVGDGTSAVELDGEAKRWEREAETNPERADVGLTPEHLAYVVYTSGSTGKPKGVAVTHGGMSNYVNWAMRAYRVKEGRGTSVHSSLSFDLTVTSLYPALLSGRSVVVLPQTGEMEALAELLQSGSDFSLLKLTPSHLQMLKLLLEQRGKDSLGTRALVIGGEALKYADLEFWKRGGNVPRIVNEYGPTETVVGSVIYEVAAEESGQGDVPIGQPIANTQVYILNEKMDPVPVGVEGEIYIGGAGVARGYLNRNELTAERFVPDPYAAHAGARMYKTGDVGRWQADGNLEFLGRNDDQVKIRGFRIELGEIASRLQEHPAVAEAVIAAREGASGEKHLVAYYVMDNARGSEEHGTREALKTDQVNGPLHVYSNDPLKPRLSEGLAPELRGWLQAKLPEYMVPAAYVRMEQMPRTANGKLDRKALPAPEADAYARQAYEAPQGETEKMLAGIWGELLQVERVGRGDNFFALGGHSLQAVRVVTRIQQRLGVAMTVADLFAHPVLADLAGSLEGAMPVELPPIVRVERGPRLPLSFAQQRLFFLGQMEEASRAYHVPWGLHLRGELDAAALRRALDRIVARHEALRTTFVLLDGEPVQRIASAADRRFHLLERDLRRHRDAPAELNRLLVEHANASFNLQTGPLIRGLLVRESEDEYTLLITMHHIVSDGWSLGVFRDELSQLYSVFRHGEEDPLPELAVQYADYAIWERQWLEGEVLRQQSEYWKEALQGAPAFLELPTDHARPAQQDYRGGIEGLVLEHGLTAGLKELSWRQGTTLYMTLLAGWAALLARLSGQAEVVIGTSVANRGRAEVEGLIGFFANTLALRVDVSGAVSVKELLKRVKEVALGGQQNHNLPFERVVEIVQPERSLTHNPLFQVSLAWQNTPEGAMMLGGVEAKPLESLPYQAAKFDLTLFMREANGTITGELEYATSLFEPGTIRRYREYFRRLLEGMVAHEWEMVDRLGMLSESEREQVLYQWNETSVEFPSNKTVHELFAEQVEKTPKAVAVEYEGRQLTYGELNRQANRLAHYLQILGVKPEARVAICVERGLEMIVGLLAILKAGGAYVPLDPAYPQERLQYMLEDSEPVALLTQAQVRERLGPLPAGLPTLDLTDAVWSSQPESNPEAAGSKLSVGHGHLAYVVYTSGSTGKPKGVMVSHQNLVSSTFARKLAYGELGRFLLLSSISFDSSVAGIFGSLLHGGTLIIASSDVVRDPLRLNQEVQRLGVESLLCVPSLYKHFLEYSVGSEKKKQLSRVIVAGEVCPPGLSGKVSSAGTPG